MEEAVLIYKKKKFMDWFLRTFMLKQPEMAKVVNFLIGRDELVKNIHFVENVRHLPNALIISAVDAVTVSFLCRINGEYYEDAEDILAILDSDQPPELFVWLSFNPSFMCSACQSVLRVGPEIREKMFYYQVITELEAELNKKIEAREEAKARLKTEIDTALDLRDRARFFELAARYKELLG